MFSAKVAVKQSERSRMSGERDFHFKWKNIPTGPWRSFAEPAANSRPHRESAAVWPSPIPVFHTWLR